TVNAHQAGPNESKSRRSGGLRLGRAARHRLDRVLGVLPEIVGGDLSFAQQTLQRRVCVRREQGAQHLRRSAGDLFAVVGLLSGDELARQHGERVLRGRVDVQRHGLFLGQFNLERDRLLPAPAAVRRDLERLHPGFPLYLGFFPVTNRTALRRNGRGLIPLTLRAYRQPPLRSRHANTRALRGVICPRIAPQLPVPTTTHHACRT